MISYEEAIKTLKALKESAEYIKEGERQWGGLTAILFSLLKNNYKNQKF